jgi:hypothetical protein
MNKSAVICGFFAVLLATPALAAPKESSGSKRLSRQVLEEKIRGGWAGQMIGVSYGAHTEFKSNGRIFEGELPWKPDMINNTIHQDDLYVEMTFAKVMDTVGLDATTEQYGEMFKESKYHLWHANAGARRALNQGIKAPWSGHPKYNIHANDIDFQIEADFIGLMCPGLPQVSNALCDRVGRVMNYGDGLYGGMFVCGAYAAAFFENDPRKVVEAGLACIPPKSSYGRLIRDVLDWSAEHPEDWRKVWQLIEDKWNKDDPCPDGALVPFNIDAKLNGGYIAMGLLYGQGDFLKTLEVSTRCGQDSDCNPSNAAGILGVMLGYSGIPEVFTAGIPKIADTKFDYTDYSFNDICRSTLNRALTLIQKHGGEVTDSDVVVRLQKSKAPRLEQWDPGIPDQLVQANDSAWTWSGSWSDHKGAKASTTPGDEVTFKFNGVAVALVGLLNQNGGRAEVFLDGKRMGIADAYIVERTHDNALWHTYGLRPGDHTLRVVTLADADPRSQGNQITIQRAVVYSARGSR